MMARWSEKPLKIDSFVYEGGQLVNLIRQSMLCLPVRNTAINGCHFYFTVIILNSCELIDR